MKKILYVNRIIPYPIQGGDTLTLKNEISALENEGYKIDLLFLKRNEDDLNLLETTLEKYGLENIYFADAEPKINFRCIFDWIFKKRTYIFNRFYSQNFSNKLMEIIEQNDYSIIVFEHAYMFMNVYLNKKIYDKIKKQNIKLVIDGHVSEGIALERLYLNNKEKYSPIKKFFQKREIKLIKDYEAKFLNLADRYILHGTEDLEIFKTFYPEFKNKIKLLEITPFLNNYDYSPPDSEKKDSIYYLGAYSWYPNTDGLKYFINDILPKILEKNKNVKFYIIGMNATDDIKKLHDGKNIFFVGQVDNIFEEIKKYSVLVAPLRIGGGTRLKLLEGISWGKAIVTTASGVEGINLHDENPIIISDDPQIFADKVLDLLANDEKRIKLKETVRNFAKKYYTFEKFRDNMINILGFEEL